MTPEQLNPSPKQEEPAAPLCQRPSCGKPAKLQCPTCVKTALPPAHYCSNDCFKGSWNLHKLCHSNPATGGGDDVEKTIEFDPFPEKAYHCKLRARYPLSPTRAVPAHIKRPEYAKTGRSLQEEIHGRQGKMLVLKPEERDEIRRIAKLGREVLDAGARAIKAGVTTDEIDRIIHEETIKRDAYPSPLNYYGFPKSCCTSVNEVICHGIPDRRPLENGDIVNLDVTIYKDGFHADLNETYFVGEVDDDSRKLVQATYDALHLAIKEVCKPGAKYRDIGGVIQAHTDKFDLSVVRRIYGHGIGKLFHALPNVAHYANNKMVGVMQPGHCFTIEPMVNLGTHKEECWMDGWTVTTVDYKRSAQFEHMILITEDGCEILTERLENSPGFDRLSN
ncbi:methionine aminopeptidase [Ramicandelaber brevisporus]|nr:methionine aminopeptidase [Ramicandelaber brevisporus]